MAYTCPRCKSVSHHPEDERNRYCVRCHRFESEDSAAALLTSAGRGAVAPWPQEARVMYEALLTISRAHAFFDAERALVALAAETLRSVGPPR